MDKPYLNKEPTAEALEELTFTDKVIMLVFAFIVFVLATTGIYFTLSVL